MITDTSAQCQTKGFVKFSPPSWSYASFPVSYPNQGLERACHPGGSNLWVYLLTPDINHQPWTPLRPFLHNDRVSFPPGWTLPRTPYKDPRSYADQIRQLSTMPTKGTTVDSTSEDCISETVIRHDGMDTGHWVFLQLALFNLIPAPLLRLVFKLPQVTVSGRWNPDLHNYNHMQQSHVFIISYSRRKLCLFIEGSYLHRHNSLQHARLTWLRNIYTSERTSELWTHSRSRAISMRGSRGCPTYT